MNPHRNTKPILYLDTHSLDMSYFAKKWVMFYLLNQCSFGACLELKLKTLILINLPIYYNYDILIHRCARLYRDRLNEQTLTRPMAVRPVWYPKYTYMNTCNFMFSLLHDDWFCSSPWFLAVSTDYAVHIYIAAALSFPFSDISQTQLSTALSSNNTSNVITEISNEEPCSEMFLPVDPPPPLLPYLGSSW